MRRWDCYRHLALCCCTLGGSLLLGLAAGAPARGEDPRYPLADSMAAGAAQQVSVEMTVTGNLRVMDQGKVQDLEMAVNSQQQYTERVLQTRPARQSLRWYTKAEAKLVIAGETIRPTLRNEQRLVMTSAGKDHRRMFAARQALTRDELDLLDLQANSLLIPMLLPDKPVAVGDKWNPDGDLLAQILGIDAVSNSQVECVLAEAQEAEHAKVILAGQVNGAVDGVATEIHVDGTLTYHFQQKCLTAASLTVREQRAIGHVGPGLNVTCKIDLKLQPITTAQLPAELTAPAPTLSAAEQNRLAYIAPANAYQFSYDRRWNVMHETPDLLSLRLVDKGELIAQCNISPMKPVAPEQTQTVAQFKESVKKAIGERLEKFTAEEETKNAAGHRLVRLEAIGAVDGLEVEWHYFLVADDRGHQVACGVTLERGLRAQLGQLDSDMLHSLRWNAPSESPANSPRPAVQSAQQPTPAAR